MRSSMASNAAGARARLTSFAKGTAVSKQTNVGKPARVGRRSRRPVVEVTKSAETLQIWLHDGGGRQLAGSVGAALASDARRLGQDLVDELIDDALREAERRATPS